MFVNNLILNLQREIAVLKNEKQLVHSSLTRCQAQLYQFQQKYDDTVKSKNDEIKRLRSSFVYYKNLWDLSVKHKGMKRKHLLAAEDSHQKRVHAQALEDPAAHGIEMVQRDPNLQNTVEATQHILEAQPAPEINPNETDAVDAELDVRNDGVYPHAPLQEVDNAPMAKRSKLYSNVSRSQRYRIQQGILSILGRGLPMYDESVQINALIKDLGSRGRTTEVAEATLHNVLQIPKLNQVLRVLQKRKLTAASKDIDRQTIAWLNTKLAGVGRDKGNDLLATMQSLQVNFLSMNDNNTEGPDSAMTIKLSSKTIGLVKEHLQQSVPCFPQVIVSDAVGVENSFTCFHDFLLSQIYMFYTQQAYHSKLIWFQPHGITKVGHWELRLYFDQFTILKNRPCCSMTVGFINFPELLHLPNYNVPITIFLDSEHSNTAESILRPLDIELEQIVQNGIEFQIEGQDLAAKVPHTDIPMNGHHKHTIGVLMAGDAPSQMVQNGGPPNVNLRWPLPESESSKAMMNHPDHTPRWRTFEEKLTTWEKMEPFISSQHKKYEKEKTKIEADSNLSVKEKQDKVLRAKKKLSKSVNDEAARYHTCINRMKPYFWSRHDAPCMLHGDCGVLERFWLQLEEHAVKVTMNDSNCPKILYDPSQRGTGKGVSYFLPDLSKLGGDAPLKRLFMLAKQMSISSIVRHMQHRFNRMKAQMDDVIETENDANADIDSFSVDNSFENVSIDEGIVFDQKDKEKFRLIGGEGDKLMLRTADAIDCLVSRDETKEQKMKRLVLASFAHNMRCLSALQNKWVMIRNWDELGAKWLGEKQLKQIHRFSLQNSVLTFKVCRSGPHSMDKYKHRFSISATESLNVGLYAKGEGPERKHKDLKKQAYTMTNLHKYFLKTLLQCTYLIIIAGTTLYAQFVPPPNKKNWLTERTSTFDKLFGKVRENTNQCQCCRKQDCTDLKPMSEHLDDIGDAHYNAEGIAEKLSKKAIHMLDDFGVAHACSMSQMFSSFLFHDLDKICCHVCAHIFQLEVASELDDQENLCWVFQVNADIHTGDEIDDAEDDEFDINHL